MTFLRYAHNAEFKGGLTLFGAGVVHKILQLDTNTVSKWRNRRFFTSGELIGVGYVYTIEDIAKLVFLKEMNDVGVKMMTAATAADIAAVDIVAHAIRRDYLIEAWGSSKTDMEKMVETIRTHEDVLANTFQAADQDFQEPYNYVVTGGDDFDDWQLIDSRDDIDGLEDFNIVRILVDLREVADRVIRVLKNFGPVSEGREPVGDETPYAAASFYTPDCMEESQIVRFSTCNGTAIIHMDKKVTKPDLKVVE